MSSFLDVDISSNPLQFGFLLPLEPDADVKTDADAAADSSPLKRRRMGGPNGVKRAPIVPSYFPRLSTGNGVGSHDLPTPVSLSHRQLTPLPDLLGFPSTSPESQSSGDSGDSPPSDLSDKPTIERTFRKTLKVRKRNGLSSAASVSPVRGNGQAIEPSSPPSTPKLPKPDLSGFDSPVAAAAFDSPTGSPIAARRHAGPMAPRKAPPKTPCAPRRQSILDIPFVNAAKEAGSQLGRFSLLDQPLTLEIAPGDRRTFSNIEFLSAQGAHSRVYKAQVGADFFVLKANQTEDDVRMLVQVTCQFMRYCQSRNVEEMNAFVPIHHNFEPYYQALLDDGFFDEARDLDDLYFDLKQYIKSNMTHGLIVMPYVPDAFFPRAFDKADPAWLSLKELFGICHRTGICHDLNPDNIHLDGNQVKLIDLYERDQDDHFDEYAEKYMDAYGISRADHKTRNWLCPWRGARAGK